jgi:hypothetical protein
MSLLLAEITEIVRNEIFHVKCTAHNVVRSYIRVYKYKVHDLLGCDAV